MSYKMHLGNCIDLLPSIGHVDTVITDPVWPNSPDNMFPYVDDA